MPIQPPYLVSAQHIAPTAKTGLPPVFRYELESRPWTSSTSKFPSYAFAHAD